MGAMTSTQRRAGSWVLVLLAALYLASASWSVAFTVGNSWLTFAVLVVMVAAALRALWVAMNHPLRSGVRRWEARLESFTVGLYCGWVTVAVFVNLASALGDQELGASRPVRGGHRESAASQQHRLVTDETG